jgi:hypothetical protein
VDFLPVVATVVRVTLVRVIFVDVLFESVVFAHVVLVDLSVFEICFHVGEQKQSMVFGVDSYCSCSAVSMH